MTEVGLGTESVLRGKARVLCRETRVNELHLTSKTHILMTIPSFLLSQF